MMTLEEFEKEYEEDNVAFFQDFGDNLKRIFEVQIQFTEDKTEKVVFGTVSKLSGTKLIVATELDLLLGTTTNFNVFTRETSRFIVGAGLYAMFFIQDDEIWVRTEIGESIVFNKVRTRILKEVFTRENSRDERDG
jgi:hypothetical protein